MDELIQLFEYPVKNVLELLLKDKTTKENIIFATDAYMASNSKITPKTHITVELLRGLNSFVIQPRVYKSLNEQSNRTKNKAEVFTPSWICNKMVNYCDNDWFGRSGVFNTEVGNMWVVSDNPVQFTNPNDWKKYVDSIRLEITCGEAPYVVSRYDASSGVLINIHDRIGILDRKIRIVSENTTSEEEWIKWIYRAYQSVYGYEFQGDNLLVARINLLNTFVDYFNARLKRLPNDSELKKITDIICWNFWQMDGLTGSIPLGKASEQFMQTSLFDYGYMDSELKFNETNGHNGVDCKIYDWRKKEQVKFIKFMEKK